VRALCPHRTDHIVARRDILSVPAVAVRSAIPEVSETPGAGVQRIRTRWCVEL